MAEQLELFVTANIDDAKKGLHDLSNEAGKTGDSLRKIAPAANEGLKPIVPQAKVVQLAVSNLGRTIDDLQQKVKGKQALISTSRDITEIARLNKEIQALQAEIVRVQNIGKTGFNEFGQASAEATDKLISGFNNAFSAVRRLAFILPGIGIAGIIGFASEAVIGFAKDLFNLGNAFDDAAISSANFQNELKSLDDFLESTKKEFDFSNEINKLKNQLTFGRGFKADILSEGFDLEAAKKRFDELGRVLDDEFKQINSKIGLASIALGKEGKKLFDSFGQTVELIPQDLIDKLGDSDKKFLSELKSLSEQAAKINKERGVLQSQIEKDNLQSQVDAHEQQLKEQKEFLQKQQQQIKDFLAAAQKNFKFFEIPVELRITDFDSEIEKIRKGLLIIQGIREFKIPLKFDFDLPDIKELPKEQVEKFFKNVPNALQDAINKGLIDSQPLELLIQPKSTGEDAFSKEITDILAKFNNLGIEIPLSIQVDAATGKLKGGSADFLKALLDAFKPKEVEKKLQEQMQQALDNAFANLTIEGLSNLGEAIGGALSGGDLNAGFKAFTDAVGSALESLGKQMIALSPVIAALKLAIKTLNPAILLPAGIALVAIGAALRNLIGNGLQGFAKGGDPDPNKPFIAGEKGWELVVPKTSMHVFTHEQSKSILSSSIKEHETIKEYLIAAHISQQLKEHFTIAFRSIETNVKTLAINNDKIATYSYKLHENIQSLKESFVSSATNNSEVQKLLYNSISSLKESFTNKTANNFYKESLASISSNIEKITEKPATIDKSSHYENSFDNINSSVEKLHDKISSHSSVTIERIINNNFFSTDSFKETFKSMSIMNLQKMFNIPAFAQGGAVFGPTLAILGEGFGISRSNPEFVGTASQLKGIQGGQFDVNVSVDGELSFSMGKLAIALNREVRSQLRTSGKPPF